MIEEQFVSFDTAKLLKEIGFNIPINSCYSEDGNSEYSIFPNNFNKLQSKFSRPTQALAARWLREVHGIHVYADVSASGWYYNLCKSDNGTHILWSSYQGPNDGGKWDSYEEALEAGLLKAIKLIKNKDYEEDSFFG